MGYKGFEAAKVTEIGKNLRPIFQISGISAVQGSPRLLTFVPLPIWLPGAV